MENNSTVTTKAICPDCKGHGGTWNGVTDYVECTHCDGWGHLLVDKCAECDRIFDHTNEIDHAEWLYGHDCEVE